MDSLKKLALFFFMSLAIVACSGDDDNGDDGSGDNNNNGGGELFTAKVDGVNFSASTDPATLIGGTLSTSGGITVLGAQGSTNDGKYINFSIVGYNGTGTYTTADNLTNPNLIQYGELNGGNAQAWLSNGIAAAGGAISAGTINVTSQDANGAEGTFSFQGYNGNNQTVKTITEGQFKITFD